MNGNPVKYSDPTGHYMTERGGTAGNCGGVGQIDCGGNSSNEDGVGKTRNSPKAQCLTPNPDSPCPLQDLPEDDEPQECTDAFNIDGTCQITLSREQATRLVDTLNNVAALTVVGLGAVGAAAGMAGGITIFLGAIVGGLAGYVLAKPYIAAANDIQHGLEVTTGDTITISVTVRPDGMIEINTGGNQPAIIPPAYFQDILDAVAN